MAAAEECPVCRHDEGVSTAEGPTADSLRCGCLRCGTFTLGGSTATILANEHIADRHVLSGVLRDASDRGEPWFLRPEDIDELIASAKVPKGPLAAADRLLDQLSRRANQFSSPIPIDPKTDYPLAFGRDASDIEYLVEYLGSAGLLDLKQYDTGAPYRITLEGWQHLERLRQTTPDLAQAFVGMWFDESLREAWELGFERGLRDAGYEAVRIDRVHHNEKICDRILAEIRRSGLMVADFTGERGGVYFEAGFALGLGLPVVWTCRADHVDRLHFDTQQYNHVVWTSPDDLRTQLTDRVVATIGAGPLGSVDRALAGDRTLAGGASDPSGSPDL